MDEEVSGPEGLESGYIVVSEGLKVVHLLNVLNTEANAVHPARKLIVFFATGAEVDHWYKVRSR